MSLPPGSLPRKHRPRQVPLSLPVPQWPSALLCSSLLPVSTLPPSLTSKTCIFPLLWISFVLYDYARFVLAFKKNILVLEVAYREGVDRFLGVWGCEVTEDFISQCASTLFLLGLSVLPFLMPSGTAAPLKCSQGGKDGRQMDASGWGIDSVCFSQCCFQKTVKQKHKLVSSATVSNNSSSLL